MSSYRCEGVASKESNLMPCRDEDPCCIVVRVLREVRPDVTWGPSQDGRLLALSVEDSPSPAVVHISPEWCYNPPVSSNWKSYGCELRHLPQERYKTIVVNLRRRYKPSYSIWIRSVMIYVVQHVRFNHCDLSVLLGGVRVEVREERRGWANRGFLTSQGKQQHGAVDTPITDVCTSYVANWCYLYSVKWQQLRKPDFSYSWTCKVTTLGGTFMAFKSTDICQQQNNQINEPILRLSTNPLCQICTVSSVAVKWKMNLLKIIFKRSAG